MKYVFPAVFHPEKEGGFSIYFPDVPGCYSQAETLEDCCDMAQDALNLALLTMEEEKLQLPVPSSIHAINTDNPADILTLISIDTLAYSKLYGKKSVKKTLSIPQWLDTIAQRNNVNFSNVLQKALIKKLHLG